MEVLIYIISTKLRLTLDLNWGIGINGSAFTLTHPIFTIAFSPSVLLSEWFWKRDFILPRMKTGKCSGHPLQRSFDKPIRKKWHLKFSSKVTSVFLKLDCELDPTKVLYSASVTLENWYIGIGTFYNPLSGNANAPGPRCDLHPELLPYKTHLQFSGIQWTGFEPLVLNLRN